MKDKKREVNLYSLFDYRAMIAHLEKMALKGWKLEKTGTTLWTYSRIEPKHLHYAITYFPDGTVYDPEPSREQLTYWDYCREAGWEKVDVLGQMQIFCSEAEDPTPIETDPVTQVKNIHASLWREQLFSNIAMLLISLIYMARMVDGYMRQPVTTLATGGMLTMLASVLVLGLLYVYRVTAYLVWFFRAKSIAEKEGRFLAPKGSFIITMLMVCLVFLGMVFAAIVMSDAVMRLVLLVAAAAISLVLAIAFAVRSFLKRNGAPRQMNAVIVAGLITFFIAILHSSLIPYAVEEYVKENEDTTDTMLMCVEDFCDDTGVTYSFLIENRESVFLKQQYAHQLADYSTGGYDLFYNVVKIKYPELYDLCADWMFTEEDRVQAVTSDASAWNADAVYYRQYNENYVYYIFCEDIVAIVRFGWEPTEEHIALAARKIT